MKISIIIPCLNEAEYIAATLKPLQDMRQRGHQVILCDGHSHDQTSKLAAPFVDKIIRSPAGRARQMNAAAQIAEHDILWFLHADTQAPAHGDRLILNSNSIWGRFDIRLTGSSVFFRMIEKMTNLRSCLSGIATGDQGIFIKKDIFEQLGGYTEIPLMEDIELSTKLNKISSPACIRTPLTTSSRRWEKHGIFKTILLMWHLRLAYFLGTPAEKLAQAYRSN